MASELEQMLDHIDDFQAYLMSDVALKEDFLGRTWLAEQVQAVKTRKEYELSYLFTRLFWHGFVASRSLPADFGQGVRKITQMLQTKYTTFASNSDVNSRFFWGRQDDFEGLWSEAIFLDYLMSQRIEAEPNLEKRRFDIVVKQDHTTYPIEVKTILHNNDRDPLKSGFESFLLDDKPALRLRRALRSKSKQLGKTQNAAIAIDISLYHDAVITILASIITNSLEKGLNSQIRSLKHRGELPVLLFFRDSYTGLAAGCLLI